MRVLSLARFLFALLAFQLAVGLQVGAAYAAAPAAAPAMVHTSDATAGDDACPMHAASSRLVPPAQVSPAQVLSAQTPHAKAAAGSSAGKHDCCKSSGCQGHCGSVPLAFNVSLTRNPPASTRVQPANTERAVVAPADTHFRPPILS